MYVSMYFMYQPMEIGKISSRVKGKTQTRTEDRGA